jgi:hypothetical protein
MNHPYRVSSYQQTKQFLNAMHPMTDSIECRGSEIPMNGGKNRAVVLGLVVLAVGAVMGLVAGNKEIREQLNQKSKKLFNKE